jgi:hypothetical protein
MTTDHKLAIAAMATAIVAPLIKSLFDRWLAKPNASPEANQQKNRDQRKRGFFRSNLWALIIMAFNILVLALLLIQTRPLDRWSVLGISASTSSILFYSLYLTVAKTVRLMERFVGMSEFQAMAMHSVMLLAQGNSNVLSDALVGWATTLTAELNKPSRQRDFQSSLESLRTQVSKVRNDELIKFPPPLFNNH